MKISVIICTHNPREEYLRRTLDSLGSQTLPKEQWELVLIDNASAEQLAAGWDLSWHPHGRHILEQELGHTAARLRGIRETTRDLLVFVDDDNVLDPGYLSKALAISKRMPGLGCFGSGALEPEFEEQPQPELLPYVPMLALRSVSEARWSNAPDDPWVPWGAGLCVTRVVAERYLESIEASKYGKQLGRKGTGLNSGDDDEFSWTACSLGLGRGIFPELRITHLIAARRVEKSYLLQIAQGTAFSHAILNHLHGIPVEVPDAPDENVGPGKVLGALLRGSVSLFFYEGHRWWVGRNRPQSIRSEFDRSRREGILKALEFLERPTNPR